MPGRVSQCVHTALIEGGAAPSQYLFVFTQKNERCFSGRRHKKQEEEVERKIKSNLTNHHQTDIHVEKQPLDDLRKTNMIQARSHDQNQNNCQVKKIVLRTYLVGFILLRHFLRLAVSRPSTTRMHNDMIQLIVTEGVYTNICNGAPNLNFFSPACSKKRL